MAKTATHIYIGIKGFVLALSRSTGQEVWRAPLKGGGFVNIAIDGDLLYATTSGQIWCLAATTGQVLWNNPLKGLGFGLVTVAGTNIAGSSFAAMKQQMDIDAAAASSTAT